MSRWLARIDLRDVAIVAGIGCLFAGLLLWFGLAVALTGNGALLLAGGVYGYVTGARGGG